MQMIHSRSGHVVSVAESFDGETKPVRVSILYQLGLFLIALAMVLLPVIYIALIALAAFGTYYHAVYNVTIFQLAPGLRGRAAAGFFLLKIALYAGPIIAGIVLVIFMIKPFFAKRVHEYKSFSIQPNEEPVLFEFIRKICTLVKAPVPTRVDVDCNINASASFRRGFLSLLGNDLVLTIGLPLVASLNVRQFAGVLAHEFGHFAQGTGMRFTYIIFRINQWFARAVSERDEWDEWLENSTNETDWRIALVFYFSQFVVWITRGILWCLMMAAHGLSCFMSRQMEYDADAYEIRVAGSQAFETTCLKLQELAAATDSVFEDLKSSWREKKLPNDLPVYILNKTEVLPETLKNQLVFEGTTRKTGLFDTHPSDADRIRRSRQAADSGICVNEEPAQKLFSNFKDLSRKLTRYHYLEEVGIHIEPENLVEIETKNPALDTIEEQVARSQRYSFGLISEDHQLRIFEKQILGFASSKQLVENIQSSRSRLDAHGEEISWLIHQRTHLDKKLLDRLVNIHRLKSGFQPDDPSQGSEEITLEKAQASYDHKLHEMTILQAKIKPFEDLLLTLLSASLQLLNNPHVGGKIANVQTLKKQVAAYAPALSQLSELIPLFEELRQEKNVLEDLLRLRLEVSESPQELDEEILAIAIPIQKKLFEIQQKLAEIPYPLMSAHGKISVAQYLSNGKLESEDVDDLLAECEHHLTQMTRLYWIILSKLIQMAEEVEKNI